MNVDVAEKVAAIVRNYASVQPDATAQALQAVWLEFEPNKGIILIKAEQRARIEAIGIPVPILKAIGTELVKAARKDVNSFLPLAQCLWDSYGREGRIIALILFGAMELAEPQRLVPLLRKLCKQCASWEDADRLAMDAVEPIVRKYPDQWLGEIAAWLGDENKWVRRAAITIIGRLPLKHPTYTSQCLELTERLLFDTDTDVRRAVSFAIRFCAKANPSLVCAFLKRQVSLTNHAAVWVLCDTIKSMDRKILPEFVPLLPLYQTWSTSPAVSGKDKRSLESAIKVLQASGK